MNRVTGIGGIFFKAKDPALLQDWYRRHLGIPVEAIRDDRYRRGPPGSRQCTCPSSWSVPLR